VAPSDSLSAACPFPGPPVIGRRTPHPRRTRAEEGLSSSHDSLLDIPRSLRRRVLRRLLQAQRHLPWPSPVRYGLGSLLPCFHRSHNDAASFASCCGLPSCSTPLRHRHLYRPRGLHYRGPWCLPGPDLHRLVIVSLSLGYVMLTPLCSWRPSCWTHTGREPQRPGQGVPVEPSIAPPIQSSFVRACRQGAGTTPGGRNGPLGGWPTSWRPLCRPSSRRGW
jgi:hypothetical protein